MLGLEQKLKEDRKCNKGKGESFGARLFAIITVVRGNRT